MTRISVSDRYWFGTRSETPKASAEQTSMPAMRIHLRNHRIPTISSGEYFRPGNIVRAPSPHQRRPQRQADPGALTVGARDQESRQVRAAGELVPVIEMLGVERQLSRERDVE